MIIYRRSLLVAFIAASIVSSLTKAQAPVTLDGAELKLAVKKLSVLGSALYIAAHPDDENTALLASLAKGRLVRAAYLAVTRGEGGQNLIGSEQGDEMGVIRTQELLAARRVDGAEQYFTRAIDFGYSKTSEETMEIWGRGKIVSDIVWVIRKLRPDVIMTRFSPTLGGHGNHTSSAILAEEAFAASGDPNRFPEQLKYVKPWKAKRLVFNTARFFDASFDTVKAVKIDVGEYNALLGRSYTEIAGMSRTNHKSQGFGAAQTRGPNINYFRHTGGDSAKKDLFDGVDLSWSRVKGGEIVAGILTEVDRTFEPERPSESLSLLLKAYDEIAKLRDDYWIDLKTNELLEVIKLCSGLWLDANASDFSAVPGTQVKINATAINRSNSVVSVDSVAAPYTPVAVLRQPLKRNVPLQTALQSNLPGDVPYSSPFWLRTPPDKGSYNISDQTLVGTAQNTPPLNVTWYVTIQGHSFAFESPVQYRWVDPVDGELYRPLEIIPAVALNLHEKVFVFSNEDEKPVTLTLKSGSANARGTVRLILPQGWSSKPESISFELKAKNDEQVVNFSVRSSKSATSGSFSAEATVDGKPVSHGMTTIRYKHIPPQTLFPEAYGKLVRMDLNKNGRTVGYIMGAGDEIPTALRQMGYQVTLLTDDDLANRTLTNVDVIVAGVRAYNTRPALRTYQKRLMEYVQNGGTYIVQYVTQQRQESENIGPYPFNVSRDRVTVEDAPVKFVNPQHPLVNYPNKITSDDFKGWIQEIGLYFADKWDAKYDSVIASADPGESLKSGGLLHASYGKGHYVYTGLSFFRQLPAGVPGAYRLFSNLLSVGKKEAPLKRSIGLEKKK